MQTFSKFVPSYYNSFKLWERNLKGFVLQLAAGI